MPGTIFTALTSVATFVIYVMHPSTSKRICDDIKSVSMLKEGQSSFAPTLDVVRRAKSTIAKTTFGDTLGAVKRERTQLWKERSGSHRLRWRPEHLGYSRISGDDRLLIPL